MTFPFFVFSLIFAIEIHPFFSDVSMTFACFFRGLCAFLCAFGKIAQFESTHFTMKSCKKALKSYDFKAFWWSEWRDLNPRPHGPEPCALPTALHPDVQHGYYKDFSPRCQEPTHSFFLFCILSSLVLSIYWLSAIVNVYYKLLAWFHLLSSCMFYAHFTIQIVFYMPVSGWMCLRTAR